MVSVIRAVLRFPNRASAFFLSLFLTIQAPFLHADDCSPVPPNLLAWFKGQGNFRSEVGLISGVGNSDVTFQPGKVGQAFVLDGVHGFTLAESSTLSIQTFTIEAWIQRGSPASVTLTGSGAGVFLGGGDRSFAFGINSAGNLFLSLVNVTATYSTATITDTAWHHVAVTRSGSTVQFYIDGRPVGADYGYVATFSVSGRLAIGQTGELVNGLTYGFLGSMDEVSVYGRSLSSDEISAIAVGGASGKCQGEYHDIGFVKAPTTARVAVGEALWSPLSVTNNGTLPEKNVQVRLTFPTHDFSLLPDPGLNWVSNGPGSVTIYLGDFGASESRRISWTQASTTVGDVDVEARVSHDGPDNYAANDVQVVSVSVLGDCLPQPAGAVSWWRGEQLSDGRVVDSLHRNDGQMAQTVTLVPGMIGQAYHLDGSSWIPLLHPETLPASNFTMEGWFQRDSSLTAGPNGNGVLLGGGSGSFSMFLTPAGTLSISRVQKTVNYSSITINDTAWHHIAATVTDQTITLYVDGMPSDPIPSQGPFDTSTPMAIGALAVLADGLRYPFQGSVDELTVYSRILDPSEILGIRQSGKSGKCSSSLTLSATIPSAVGQNETFTIVYRVKNDAIRSAQEVVLTSTLPEGFTVLSLESSQGTTVVNPTSRVTTLGTLPASGEATVTIVGQSHAIGIPEFQGQAVATGYDPASWSGRVDVYGSCVAPPEGLVAWLRGEGTLQDELSHSVSGNGIQYTDGRVGSAFLFSSGNVLALADSPEINSKSLTLETWVYPTAYDGNVNTLAMKASGASTGEIEFGMGVKGSIAVQPTSIPTGNVVFILEGVAGLPHEFGDWSDGGASVPLNQWSHLALTISSSSVTVYVNGKVTRTFAGLSGSPTLNRGPLYIGTSPPQLLALYPAERWVGKLDEFSVYNRSLSASEILSLYSIGGAGKCVTPIPVAISVPPKDQTVLVGGPASFSVSVYGASPFTYQWLFNQTLLPGETNAQLTLPTTARSDAGTYTVQVCNAAGCTTHVSAQLTVNRRPVPVSVVPTVARSLRTVELPVLMVCDGVENAVSFSLNFDGTLFSFNSVQVGNDALSGQLLVNYSTNRPGKVGVALALPSGTALPQGTNEVVRIVLNTSLQLVDRNTVVSFGDVPTQREIVDSNSGNLTANWLSSPISIQAAAFEGDVSPLPSGDRRVGIGDWVQVGRYVAGLDDVPANLFQAADCAPWATFGDGLLTVIDWVQAGRFAVGLDPLTGLGGPASPGSPGPNREHRGLLGNNPRTISLNLPTAYAGRTNGIGVVIAASGDENALAFTCKFDTNALTFIGASSGGGLPTASLNVNTRKVASGVVGITLALSTGSSFPAGSIEAVRLRFSPTGSTQGPSPLSFVDSPVYRQVASAAALPLPADWQDAEIQIVLPRLMVGPAPSSQDGRWTFSWPSNFAGARLEMTTNLSSGPWTAVAAEPTTTDTNIWVTIPHGTGEGFFRLRLP